MKRSDMARLLTAFVNLKCCKTVDAFSGDRLMTLEEGAKLLAYIEKYMKLDYIEEFDTEARDEHGDFITDLMRITDWDDEDADVL